LWKYGEELAAKFLESQGLELVKRNYRCERAEIDLIFKNESKRLLVFAEVKTRSSKSYGEPEESVTFGKVEQLVKAVHGFIMEHEEYADFEHRFDVIAIYKNGKQEKINHIINAI
jgi:putative endonuclease